jgi:hypothetical protein
MTAEELQVAEAHALIDQLPADQAEAVIELANHIKTLIKTAGVPVGTMALVLVGVEAQLIVSQSENKPNQ